MHEPTLLRGMLKHWEEAITSFLSYFVAVELQLYITTAQLLHSSNVSSILRVWSPAFRAGTIILWIVSMRERQNRLNVSRLSKS